MGGGTGSGLGTYVLKLLKDEYPDVYRFTTAVFPSEDDDVIVSPYNSMLSMNQLIAHADCVLPVENQALLDMCNKVRSYMSKKVRPSVDQYDESTSLMYNQLVNNDKTSGNSPNKNKGQGSTASSRSKPFDEMNNIAAHLLTNLTRYIYIHTLTSQV